MLHITESKRGLSPKAREFQKEVNRANRVFERQQTQALKDVRQALSDYRYHILGAFSEVTEWDAYHVQQLKASLTTANLNVGKILSQKWINQANEVTALALAGVDSPLKKLGLPVDHMGPFVPIKELAILNEYVPSLITQVTDDVHKQVQGLMQQSLMGGITQRDMVKKLGNLVGPLKPGQRPPGTVFAKAHVRAKTIMRTEMNRLHNLTTSARIDDLAGKFPGVGKKWIHRPSNYPRASHQALHGVVIFPDGGQGKDKITFNLDGYRIKGPHDPSLPAEHSINCHCGLVVAYNSEVGAKAAQDSPYIPGDGEDIPSAGLETPLTKEQVETRIQAGEAGIRKKGMETGIAYDKEGIEIFRQKGTTNSVAFSPAQRELMNGQTVTHNHPSGSSFSRADIHVCNKLNLVEMRAIGYNRLGEGWRHRATIIRPRHMRPETMGIRINEAVNLAEDKIMLLHDVEIAAGRMTYKEGKARFMHDVWEYIASTQDWFKYRREILK